MATVDLGDWREHWARVLRWHSRITTIGEGISFGMTRDEAVDTMLALFPVCYHLSDALARSGVKTDAGSKDMFELADECVAAWRSYLPLR